MKSLGSYKKQRNKARTYIHVHWNEQTTFTNSGWLLFVGRRTQSQTSPVPISHSIFCRLLLTVDVKGFSLIYFFGLIFFLLTRHDTTCALAKTAFFSNQSCYCHLARRKKISSDYKSSVGTVCLPINSSRFLAKISICIFCFTWIASKRYIF